MLGGVEIAPLIRLLFFTAVIVLLQISEGSGGPYWWAFVGLGCGQSLLIATAFYGVAALVARASATLSPARRSLAVLAAAAAGIALAVAFQAYDTPMSSASMHSNLLQVFR